MRRDAGRRNLPPRPTGSGEVRGCQGKQQYPTFADAQRSAETLRRHREGAVSPYHCKSCNRFHVGNRGQGFLRRERRRRFDFEP